LTKVKREGAGWGGTNRPGKGKKRLEEMLAKPQRGKNRIQHAEQGESKTRGTRTSGGRGERGGRRAGQGPNGKGISPDMTTNEQNYQSRNRNFLA